MVNSHQVVNGAQERSEPDATRYADGRLAVQNIHKRTGEWAVNVQLDLISFRP